MGLFGRWFVSQGRTAVLLPGVAALALVAAGCAGGAGGAGGDTGMEETEVEAGGGGEGGEVTLVMDEFSFVPETLTLPAGEEVDLTIVNEGGKAHELMIGMPVGSGPEWESDLFVRMEPEAMHGEGYELEGFEGMHEEEEGEEEGHAAGEMHGAEVEVEPGAEVTLRLHVPADAEGDWEMGCFLPQHYESGMKGTLVVE